MKKLLLITIIIFSYLEIISAQETFQRTIGGAENDFARGIAQTSDGGFVMVGDSHVAGISRIYLYVVKYDGHGNLLWNKIFYQSDFNQGNCITATKDGGCAVGAVLGTNTNDLAILKIDATGNLEWVKFYYVTKRHNVHAIVQTPDGGFALGGSASTYNNGSWGYVVKTDDKGNLQWSKLVFNRSFYPEIQKLVVTKDSGFALIANQNTTNPGYDVFLIKLDKAGNFQWAKSVGGENTGYFPYDLIQTSDGGYAVASGVIDLKGDPQYSFIHIFKTDLNGNFKFSKRIKGTNTDVCRSIIESNDKQYLITGSVPSPAGTSQNLFVSKIDTTGHVLWTKVIADNINSSEGVQIIHTLNGGYAATAIFGNAANYDFLLVRFDTGVNVCGATPDLRTDTDFGNLVTQIVSITNANTSAADGINTLLDVANVSVNVCTILPLNLVSFTAAKKGSNVLLEWVTAQEVNTKSFEVYKSVDGINYRFIAIVAAHGISNNQTKYNYTDEQPYAGKNFYKLKSIDKDGKYVFSEIRTIDLNNSLVKIFPNPAKDWLNVELNNIGGNFSLQVYSTDGKLMLEKLIPAQTINAKESIDVRSLKAGTYILQILNGDLKMHYVFVKN